MKPSRPPESLSQSDWQQTPPTVQAYLLNLHQRLVQLQEQIERLQNRLQRTAKTSDKPPSSDSPFQRHAGNQASPQANAAPDKVTPAQVPSYTVPPSGKPSILKVKYLRREVQGLRSHLVA